MLKIKYPENKNKKRKKLKLEDGNPRGVTGKYIKTNGKRINI